MICITDIVGVSVCTHVGVNAPVLCTDGKWVSVFLEMKLFFHM